MTTRTWAARRDPSARDPRRSRLTLLLTAALAVAMTAAAARHPYHVSIAEAEVALREDGSLVLEVALRVDPDDLDRALERRTDRRLDLDSTENVDELIVAYLDDSFGVRRPAPDEDSEPTPLDPCPLPPEEDRRPRDDPVGSGAPAVSQPEDEPGSIIRWVGKEIEIDHAWLYFEVCLPESGIEGLEFGNRILFELEPTQANTVNFQDGEWRGSLRFTRERKWRTLRKIREAGTDP